MIDSGTGELTLYDSVTKAEAGSYTALVKVYLADYTAVETQFNLKFDIELELTTDPDDKPKPSWQEDPTC